MESMACGVPAIHSSYGGGCELIPRASWLVDPIAMRLETQHNCLRPIWAPDDWTTAMERVLEEKPSVEECRGATEHLQWRALWPSLWSKWMLEGLG